MVTMGKANGVTLTPLPVPKTGARLPGGRKGLMLERPTTASCRWRKQVFQGVLEHRDLATQDPRGLDARDWA